LYERKETTEQPRRARATMTSLDADDL